jgi:hypothetical protein
MNDSIVASGNPMSWGFGREVAHRHIISDVNNFLRLKTPVPKRFGIPGFFRWN